DLLRRVPLPRGLTAVHRPGPSPPAVLRPAPHARGAGCRHRPARAHDDLAGVDRALRPPPEDRTLDAPDLALRLGHRRRHLLDAVRVVSCCGVSEQSRYQSKSAPSCDAAPWLWWPERMPLRLHGEPQAV